MFGGRAGIGALILMIGLTASAGAEALKSKDEIARQISNIYGVEVLRIRDVDMDGLTAYAMTVMNPGGNFNGAFQVNTLLVDAATGELIPTFRHDASGYQISGSESFGTEIDGRAIRRRSLSD